MLVDNLRKVRAMVAQPEWFALNYSLAEIFGRSAGFPEAVLITIIVNAEMAVGLALEERREVSELLASLEAEACLQVSQNTSLHEGVLAWLDLGLARLLRKDAN